MKKNVASQIIGAQLVNATTGAAFTGSVTVYVTGDGGTQAAGSVGSGACTHEGNGFHTYAPAQAETNYDHIGFTFIGTGAVPATIQVYPTFPQTGDNFGRLGAPAGASVSADIAAAKVDTAAIKVKTDFLPSATAGAAGGLFIAGSNAATSVTTAFTANITGNLSGSVGSVTGLTAANLDVAISTRMATYTQPTGFLAATFPLTVASTTNITAGTITTVTNLTNAPTAGDLTATMKASVTAAVPTSATIAGAVWDITLASHLTAGTTGYALNAAGAAGDPWTTALPGAYGAGSAGYIIGTNINAAITSRMATYTQPTGFLAATFPGTVASTTNITAGTISTVTTLTNLPSIPANWLTAAGIAAGALDGKGNWNIGKTGYSLTTAPPTAAEVRVEMDSNSTKLASIETRGDNVVCRGTVSATSPTTTSFTASAMSPSGAAADQFKGRIIVFDKATTTAALRGQATDITANTSASLPVFTFTALTTAPASGDTFSVV